MVLSFGVLLLLATGTSTLRPLLDLPQMHMVYAKCRAERLFNNMQWPPPPHVLRILAIVTYGLLHRKAERGAQSNFHRRQRLSKLRYKAWGLRL